MIVYYFQPLPLYFRTVVSNLTDLPEPPQVFVVVYLKDFFFGPDSVANSQNVITHFFAKTRHAIGQKGSHKTSLLPNKIRVSQWTLPIYSSHWVLCALLPCWGSMFLPL